MTNSGEESPDWLRSFQAPSYSTIALSSGSESPVNHSPVSDDEDGINLSKLFKKEVSQAPDVKDKDGGRASVVDKTRKGKSLEENEKVKLTSGRKRKSEDDSSKRKGKVAKGKDAKKTTPEKHGQPHESKLSILALSSDSESSQDTSPAKEVEIVKKELSANNEDEVTNDKEYMNDILVSQDVESPRNRASKAKSPRKKLEKVDEKTSKKKNVNSKISGENDANNIVKEDIPGNNPGLQTSSSRVPLMLSEKVQRTKALVECEGDSIDLSGDMGSVGRIVISDDHSNNHDMLLDLKGTIYKTTIVPSRTFCVVSFGQSEAKIEAIMNDYIQLKSQSNVYEAETMVEGTLEGFSFDSEDEPDNLPKPTAQTDQQEAAEEQPVGKTKRKAAKTVGSGKNKGKAAGGKQAKKVKKKPQVQKKSKAKK
ncbi:hypothetical protein ACJIZ3_022586 [Penstemon smallii]|uniref:DNA-binding protein BIN4 n=1 Tax=Penstemon smallii TaxID=265156 RepID=A0ABD3TLU1_9LAMI